MYYDERIKDSRFQKGDLVYKLDTTVRPGQRSKLKSIYIGPYLVVHTLSPVLYRIEDQRKQQVVHHDQIKLCQDRNIPLWLRRKRNELLKTEGSTEEEMGVENQTKGNEACIE